jgi:hypothetical protein
MVTTARPSANVYVDGFNLYRRALRDRFRYYKWLDLRKLAETLFPDLSIDRVRYFTARIKPQPEDPTQPQRQQAYIRALEAIGIEVHLGTFQTKPKKFPRRMRCEVPGCLDPDVVRVRFTQEKGSDVALGSYLVRDSLAQGIRAAVIVSIDGDLVAPLRIARTEAGTHIALVNPATYPNAKLEAEAHRVQSLRAEHLSAAQLPTTLTDAIGTIRCPELWQDPSQA